MTNFLLMEGLLRLPREEKVKVHFSWPRILQSWCTDRVKSTSSSWAQYEDAPFASHYALVWSADGGTKKISAWFFLCTLSRDFHKHV